MNRYAVLRRKQEQEIRRTPRLHPLSGGEKGKHGRSTS